jgi:integrase
VFTRADGSPLDPTRATKEFRTILARAGIDRPELHLHSARHTVGSLVYQATHDLKIAGAMLGHRQAATTARYYARHSDEATRAAADEYGEAIERARGGSR